GIRDGHVTGVQTCALPILLWPQNSLAGHVEDSGCQHRQAHHHEQPHPQLRPGKLFSLWHFVLSSRIPKRTLSQIHAEKRFRDRKSTRLNSSHVAISYAVFCLKKKNQSIKHIV